MLSMLEYLNQYFNIPIVAIVFLVTVFLIINIIGELLEFKGKIVPEFMKFRKYFARKKQERETLAQIPEMMNEVKSLFDDFGSHYNCDNIMKRDKWIENVNSRLEAHDERMDSVDKKLDKIEQVTVDTLIDNKRNKIIEFANRASDTNIPVTREEFARVFKIYEEYENIIEENGRTNGEVEISYRMINEAYEERTKTHSFVEDKRGYNI